MDKFPHIVTPDEQLLISQRLVVIGGPSGVGKTTVARHLESKAHGIMRLIGSTTRPMRPGEVDGDDYHFIAPENFSPSDYLESATYDGHSYGLSAAELRRVLTLDACRGAVVIMNSEGLEALREYFPDVWSVWLDAGVDVLWTRLVERGDTEEATRRRLARVDVDRGESIFAGHAFDVDAALPVAWVANSVRQILCAASRRRLTIEA